MRRVFLALPTVVLMAGSALAQPADIVVEPSWRTKPSGEQMAKNYPAAALDREISGKATIECDVRIDGRLENCEILSETPYGLGFGKAAVKVMVAGATMNPRKINGKAVAGGKMRIPVTFASMRAGNRTIIFNPVWAKAPDFEAIAAAWPEGSGAEEGVAVLRCSLRANGSLGGCTTAGATDGGFAGAARRLAPQFEMKLSPEEASRYANADVMISFQFYNPASIEARERSVKDPTWITMVKPEAVLAVYPAQAAEAGVKSGRGVADCLVAPDGKLTDCKVAREKPANLGFGASAVAIAPLMQMNPWTDKGRPVAGARIKLPIDFNLADEATR